MIPTLDVTVSADIPESATFWVPSEEELPEPGVECSIGGYLGETWYVSDVSVDDAARVVRGEMTCLGFADRFSTDAASFEAIVSAIESGYTDSLPAELRISDMAADLRELIGDGTYAAEVFGGIELGVAGLVAALNATGYVTSASCRGHHTADRQPWADHPVVYFATGRRAASRLAPLVEAAGCGLTIDEERPDLLIIEAPSIACTVRLAHALIADVVDASPALSIVPCEAQGQQASENAG